MSKRKFYWPALAALTAFFTMALTSVAVADNIGNNLDTTVDAIAETMALNVGGANGTTRLYVVPAGSDGKPGCNLTGSTTFTVSIASSNTGVATVSPSTVTFTSCVTSTTGPVLTVTPVAQGSATISLTAGANTTGGTFDVTGGRFTAVVAPPPNTAPSVSVAGVTGGASYNRGSVPAATCNVTDAEDGNSSFAATLSAVTGPYASDGIGEQIASCAYTDGGGLTASSSLTYNIIDPSAPSISYALSPTSPDGSNGWYKSNVTLTWTVTDAQSPNSLVLTGCVDQDITANQADTTYTCSATSAGGSAGPESVTIKRDATGPSVSCGTADGTWHDADVSIACTATDGTSGLADGGDASFNLSTNTAANTELSNASTGSRDVYDAAGNFATAGPVPGNMIDKKAPAVSCSPTDTIWHGTDQSVTCSATDGGSGLADSADASFLLSTNVSSGTEDAAASTGSEPVADAVGNITTAGPFTFQIDKKAPVITASLSPAASGTGWYNLGTGAPTVSFNCADGGSGIATCPASHTLGEGADQAWNGTAFDGVGNSANAGVTNVDVDLTAPGLAWSGSISDGDSFYFGSVPSAPTCTASDSGSGPNGCAVTGYGTGVGSHTLTATANDIAGNSTIQTRTYTVLAWTLKGFYAPVDMNGVWNAVKGGSTVPLKFEVFSGTTELTATSSIDSFTVKGVSCPSGGAATDDIELTTTGGTSLRYDSVAGQFIQNWQTPRKSGACYTVTMKTDDGSTISANFQLK